MKRALFFVAFMFTAGCKEKGKTCETDSQCDGKQECWCERTPLVDRCDGPNDLPAGECVSRDEHRTRVDAAEAAAKKTAETRSTAALPKLYPRCTSSLRIVGSTPNIMTGEWSSGIEGTVEFAGKVCKPYNGGCIDGPWKVAVKVYVKGQLHGDAAAHYDSGAVLSSNKPILETGDAGGFLEQACR